MSKAIPQEQIVKEAQALLNHDITENGGKLTDTTKGAIQTLALNITYEDVSIEELIEGAEPQEAMVAMAAFLQIQAFAEEDSKA